MAEFDIGKNLDEIQEKGALLEEDWYKVRLVKDPKSEPNKVMKSNGPKEKQRKNSMFSDKQREKHSDKIWRRMWEMIDAPETPPAVKANLLSLGAKAAGMLTEQVRVENITADSKDIEREIIERLQRLTA